MFHWGPLLRASVLILPLLGCAIDEHDFTAWHDRKDGPQRLAAYLVDPARPLSMRVSAAAHLFELGAVGQIMGAVHDVPPDTRLPLLDALAGWTSEQLAGQPDAEHGERARALAVYLLEYGQLMSPEQADRLATSLLDWGLARLRAPAEENAAAGSPLALDDAFLTAAVARPEVSVPRLLAALRQATAIEPASRAARALDRLRDPELTRQVAGALLTLARKHHPALPPSLLEVMLDNGNLTLLRYLLDAAADPRVPLPVREEILEQAAPPLGESARPHLLRLVAADDPAHPYVIRWAALERAWELLGPGGLPTLLHALPANGTWADEGAAFRDRVERFCDARLRPQHVAVRAPLIGLLRDAAWPARAIAGICVARLFPEEAPRLLVPVQSDPTPLPAWVPGRALTLGEAVRRPDRPASAP